jgi:hypothetical protein
MPLVAKFAVPCLFLCDTTCACVVQIRLRPDRSEYLVVDDSELAEGRLSITTNPAATSVLQLAAVAIDVEMLFSSKPFAASGGDRAGSFVQPSAVQHLTTQAESQRHLKVFPGTCPAPP